MRSKNKTESSDFIKSESSVLRGSNILWSSGKAWDGLTIEQHIFTKENAAEFKLSDNSLVIQLSPRAEKNNIKNPDSEVHSRICFFSKELNTRRSCIHHQYEMLVLALSPAMVARAARELQVNSGLTEQHEVNDAQIEYIGMALKSEAESGFLSGRLYGESLGTALSVHLLSKYSAVKPEISRHKGGLTPPNLRRVIEYIHDNLAEDIALSSLAKVANLSPFRFAHNFKQATGLAPHQYIIRERLERAKKMLRETDLTVTTIAYAVGCGSPSHFTLLFHRATGVKPSVYRSSSR